MSEIRTEAEKPQTKLPSGQVMKWKEVEYPSVYANIMGFTMSPFDIALILGEIGESTPTEVSATPRVKLLLSPEQAANLMKLLSVALTTYVQNNGQLRPGGAVNLEDVTLQLEALAAKADISK